MIFRPYFLKWALVLTQIGFFFLGARGQDSVAKRKVDSLQAATVVGKRAIVQAGIDRMRFNVAGTDLAKGNTLWGVIEKTPLARWEAASGQGSLSGVAVETDDRTGLAVKVARFSGSPRRRRWAWRSMNAIGFDMMKP